MVPLQSGLLPLPAAGWPPGEGALPVLGRHLAALWAVVESMAVALSAVVVGEGPSPRGGVVGTRQSCCNHRTIAHLAVRAEVIVILMGLSGGP